MSRPSVLSSVVSAFVLVAIIAVVPISARIKGLSNIQFLQFVVESTAYPKLFFSSQKSGVSKVSTMISTLPRQELEGIVERADFATKLRERFPAMRPMR